MIKGRSGGGEQHIKHQGGFRLSVYLIRQIKMNKCTEKQDTASTHNQHTKQTQIGVLHYTYF